MSNIYKDTNYVNIVKHILDNKEFNKIKNIEHHGVSRFDHSLRVSYYSYKVSKFLKLDYEDTARAGLLHDFFLTNDNENIKNRIISVFTHPKKASENSMKIFNINEKEKNIIESHMFPIQYNIPRYVESWIVSTVDKVIGTYEFSLKFGYKIAYVANLYIILLLNWVK